MANTVDHLCTRQSREEAVVVVWEIPITTVCVPTYSAPTAKLLRNNTTELTSL